MARSPALGTACRTKAFKASQKRYPPGWGANDRCADPRFVSLPADDIAGAVDLRLQKDSPAIDAGVPVPADWPDPLRKLDKGKKPDLGALPAGVQMLRVGPKARP